MNEYAIRGAFIPPTKKAELIAKINEYKNRSEKSDKILQKFNNPPKISILIIRRIIYVLCNK